MNKLIKMVIEYKNNKEDILFNKIIEELRGKIINAESKVNAKEKDDYHQQLLFRIYKLINKIKILQLEKEEAKKRITFFDFLKITNLKEEDVINNAENFNNYNLFNNEVQFLSMLKTMENNLYKDYKRKMFKETRFVPLDITHEYIFKLEKKEYSLKEHLIEIINKYLLSEQESQFLLCFIENNEVLDEKTISLKLGITQQAVNKRKKKILEKIRKINKS